MKARTLGTTLNTNGFTLMEVMVAMVIFAIGMMGLASLQSVSIQNNAQSGSRSQAVLLAYDMADRIRGNPAGANNYLVDNAANSDGSIPDYSTCSTGGGSCDCVSNACTNTTLANADKSAWITLIKNSLPGGKGTVTGAAPNFTVTVHWDEDRTGATGITCPPAAATDLRCFQLDLVAN